MPSGSPDSGEAVQEDGWLWRTVLKRVWSRRLNRKDCVNDPETECAAGFSSSASPTNILQRFFISSHRPRQQRRLTFIFYSCVQSQTFSIAHMCSFTRFALFWNFVSCLHGQHRYRREDSRRSRLCYVISSCIKIIYKSISYCSFTFKFLVYLNVFSSRQCVIFKVIY